MDSDQQAPKKKASIRQVAGAVFWSFFGVRKRRDYESDAVNITPVQAIVAGIIGAAIFVAILVTIVRLLT